RPRRASLGRISAQSRSEPQGVLAMKSKSNGSLLQASQLPASRQPHLAPVLYIYWVLQIVVTVCETAINGGGRRCGPGASDCSLRGSHVDHRGFANRRARSTSSRTVTSERFVCHQIPQRPFGSSGAFALRQPMPSVGSLTPRGTLGPFRLRSSRRQGLPHSVKICRHLGPPVRRRPQ